MKRIALAQNHHFGRAKLTPQSWSWLNANDKFSKSRCFHDSASRHKKVPYILADVGEGITECRILQWFVEPGSKVCQFEPICEVQSDKATVEITSRYDGTVIDLKYENDDMAVVGHALLDIEVEDENMSAAVGEKQAAPETKKTIQPLNQIEATMFKVMTESLKIPHFGFSNAVDVTELSLMRLRANEDENATGSSNNDNGAKPRFTFLSVMMKAISQSLVQFPRLNAHLNISADHQPATLSLHGAHHFGIAVDTPEGLVVPVVRDVQNHSVFSLAAEVERLASLAKTGRLSPADMQGSTLTVSNIGSIGGTAASPVIVPPTTSIVAIGRVEAVPGYVTCADGNEAVMKRQKVTLSWSADHRIHDGATIARFADAVKKKLECVEELERMIQ